MNANEFRFGFRALSRDGERKLTDGRTAFRAHIEADPRAMTAGECYLSHFVFSDQFRTHLATTGSTAGYTGPTWLQWLVFDIDVEGSFVGDRHRELFSAAANLAEFASVDELAVALLTPCGLNSGLTRSDVQRQIECGLKHGGRS